MKNFFINLELFIHQMNCTQSSVTCSKLTIETLQQGVNMFKVNDKDWRSSGDFTIIFEHILHLVLLFLLLTLSR